MSDLKKILVGIDLLQSHEGNLSPPVAQAVAQALWLALQTSGEVMFFTALDLPQEEELYTPAGSHERLVHESVVLAEETLKTLVDQAAERGVRAQSKWGAGPGWVELTREAIGGRHDVVVVGTRNQGAVRRALFGSTAMKLLHNCPGAVWVTKPEPHPAPRNLLVASDFSELCDEALRLALRIATAGGANLHLVHVLHSPFARMWGDDVGEAQQEQALHEQDRAAAQVRLKEQLARVSAGKEPAAVVSVVDGTAVPDEAIASYVAAHQIDLLVAGTSARHGLAGLFVGNTAERLLTALDCSLLAVKPADFRCPVSLESFPDRFAENLWL